MSDKNQGNKTRPILGISIGDVNGIGPEVTLKALSDNRITRYVTPVIYANGGMVSFLRRTLDLNNFNFNQVDSIEQVQHRKVNVLNVWREKVELNPGEQIPEAGGLAFKSLEAATNDLASGKINGLVTAPINKNLIQSEYFKFAGHTEYLADRLGASDSLMLMVHEGLRVGVVTGHVPISEVSSRITKELVSSKLHIMLNSLRQDFGIKKPRVAVLGLNPHAGEEGLLGNEELEIITPLLEAEKENGHLVFGPYPADGFFGTSLYRQFDGILAMYHDQGLIPFKHISGGEGVNFTAGLKAIRTSPAHGTAYNLAGKNQAEPDSMLNAIFLALDLIGASEGD